MATLILLVGTNPLPNWVVSKYLATDPIGLGPIDRTILMRQPSKRMTALAGRLKQEIDGGCYFWDLNDPRNPAEIVADVVKHRGELAGGPVHLNYTGGTKAMAVHVRRALESFEDLKGRLSFSYLDADKHLLVDDEGKPSPAGLRDLRARGECDITLERLFLLHNRDIRQQHLVHFRQTTKAWWDAFGPATDAETRADLVEAYVREWRPAAFRRQLTTRSGAKVWKNDPPKGAELQKFAPPPPPIPGVKEALWRDVPELDGCDCVGFGQITNTGTMNDLAEYLHGKWLEQVAELALDKLTGSGRIPIDRQKVQTEVEAYPKGLYRRRMELDIVCLRGYQLTLISCTSSDDIRGSKQHAFEAVHRAQQIGGEEARAVLLTLLGQTDAEELGLDMEEEYGTETPPLTILGRDDLPYLDDKLAEVLCR